MPRDCAFCKVGVMSVCTEPGCDNYICPTHTGEDGRCFDQFGVAIHSVPVDSSPLEESLANDQGEGEDDQKAASPASIDESSDDEPSTTEPSAAPRRRRKRTSKSAS